jgi:MFS family permease
VIFGGIAGGFSVERWGPRSVLIGALLCYGIMGVSGYFIESLGLLLASRFMLGFFVAQIGTAIGVVVGSWFEGVARAQAARLSKRGRRGVRGQRPVAFRTAR